MNKEQLHRYISDSTGNESNICQIYAIKDGETVYDDCWHGFATGDAMNVNSVTCLQESRWTKAALRALTRK